MSKRFMRTPGNETESSTKVAPAALPANRARAQAEVAVARAGSTLARSARARASVRAIGESRIREIANAGMGRTDVLAFWFGEPDSVTPDFIRAAAKAALDAGDTFYHHNLGLLPLRETLATYLSALHGNPVSTARVAVTSSGVNALMIAAQTLIEPGDRVCAVVPLWPNVTEIPRVLGAEVHRVALHADAQGRWRLDLDALLQAITPKTRALIINSPSNPTGWTMDAEAMQTVLEHCRAQGTWIISDEAYGRLVFDGSEHAPSLLDFATPEDRVVVANTFSKSWQMTGWRLGWLVVPEALMPDLGKLIEFNTSCAPGFVQQAGMVAVRDGEACVRAFVDELARRRETLLHALRTHAGLEAAAPDGAMYLFFRVPGHADSLALAKGLVAQVGLGLAPGSAFGPEGEGSLRWCFARPPEMLEEGARRLARFLKTARR